MDSNKLIIYKDITCNYAFVDICTFPNCLYLLSCSGKQIADYPCFGNNGSGFASHSSICSAAISSGIACGEQFIVFSVGELCNFEPTFENGMNTLPFSEWSMAFKIKKVNTLFNEHTTLKSALDKANKDNTQSKQKIKELHQKLNFIKSESQSHRDTLKLYESEKIELYKVIKSYKNEINRYKNDLEYLKKEVKNKKDYNDLKNKLMNSLKTNEEILKEKKQIEKKIKILEESLNDYIKDKKNREIKEKESEKIKTITKNLYGPFYNLLLDTLNSSKKATKNYINSQKVSNSNSQNSISDMKEIVSLFNTLKIKFTNLNDDPNTLVKPCSKIDKQIKEHFQEKLKRLNKLVTSETVYPKNLSSYIKTLLKLIKNDSSFIKHESYQTFYKGMSMNIINIIESHQNKKEKESQIHKLEEKYTSLIRLLTKTKDKINNSKKDKMIKITIQETMNMQNILSKELLPTNKNICDLLNEVNGQMKEDKFKYKDVKEDKVTSDEISLIDKDIDVLNKLEPISIKEVDKIDKEVKETEDIIKDNDVDIEKYNDELKKILKITGEKISRNIIHKKEVVSKKEKLELLEFKKFRWTELKESRLKKLKEYKEHQKSTIKISEDAFVIIKKMFDEIINRLDDECKIYREKEDSYLEKYNNLFCDLKLSYEKDLKNKEISLSKMNKMKNQINESLEEATELMDEELVSSLKNQLADLPKREKKIKSGIEEIKGKVKSLNDNWKIDKGEKLKNVNKIKKNQRSIEDNEKERDKLRRIE